MEQEHRGVALVILGIISVIAVIGLVLMFSGARKSAGAVPTLVGNEAPSGFCDSPCTFAFGANQAEVAMQTQRFMARGFVPVGQVQLKYSVDGFPLVGQCLCPPNKGVPLPPTQEHAALVYGTPLSARTPGVPSPMFVETPAPAGGEQVSPTSPPSYPYPASLNK